MLCECGGHARVVKVLNEQHGVPKGDIVRHRCCVVCGKKFRTIECRETEANFVEAFKYITRNRGRG